MLPPDPLVHSVYRKAFSRLRGIAKKLLARERPGHTLQPTALVNEAFLKLRSLRLPPKSEEHVFHLSAYAMRQVLIDHSRVRGKWAAATVAEMPELIERAERPNINLEEALAVRLLLDKLRDVDASAAEAVRLRHYVGLSLPLIALELGRSESQVRTDIEYAYHWLANQLESRK